MSRSSSTGLDGAPRRRLDYLGAYHGGDRIQVRNDDFEVGHLSFNPVTISKLLSAIKDETDDQTGLLQDMLERLKMWYLLEVQHTADALSDEYETRYSSVSEEVNEEDLVRWLSNVVQLLRRAHFVPLSHELMQFALHNDYTWTLGTDIDWKCMDPSLMSRFFESLPSCRGEQPTFAKHALIFWRGVEEHEQSEYFWVEKLDVLFTVLIEQIVRYITVLLNMVGLGEYWTPLLQAFSPRCEQAPQCSVRKLSSCIHDEAPDIIPRQSLRSQLFAHSQSPSCFRTTMCRFFGRVQIKGPAFSEVVLIYGRGNKTKHELRGMTLQYFESIPISDLEIILPHTPRKSWADWLLHVLYVCTILSTIRGFIHQPRLVLTGVIVYFGRKFLLHHLVQNKGTRRSAKYFEARRQRAKSDSATTVRRTQADNRHVREGLIQRLAQSARDQAFIEAALAFAITSGGLPRTASQIDEKCENFLRDKLNCKIDFDVERCLQELCDLGLVAKCSPVVQCHEQQQYECLDVISANCELCKKLGIRLGIM